MQKKCKLKELLPMPGMRDTLFVIILLTINFVCTAQGISWLQGNWSGKAHLPGSNPPQEHDLALTITQIKGKKFEGIFKTIKSSDPTVHFDAQVSGVVYSKYLVIRMTKILTVKNPSGGKWQITCTSCKPPDWIFTIDSEKISFRGMAKGCTKECSWVSEFSKDLSEFDSLAKESLYAFLNGPQKLEPVAAVSVETINTSSRADNTLPSSENFETKRIPLLPAGNITFMDRNTSLLSTPNPSGTLSKAPSLIVRENILLQRIPVLQAGTVIKIRRRSVLPLPQNQWRSVANKKPFLTIKETTPPLVQQKIPSSQDTIASTAGSKPELQIAIPSLRDDTLQLLPEGYAERKKNVVRTLMVNTDSIILRVYDNGVVDGDIASIIYNNEVVVDQLSLTARSTEVKVPVNKAQLNMLVFHAHNLGEYPPNTARLEIIYGNKKEELTLSSDLTVSSTIDILYEEQ